ncbi:cysteine hydrolase family protein [Geoglobus acetivorans]|uniref:Isochorismatase n=1 Tax=Geoglobus acetivorans TaxID=565033 RepID=A0A0A7GIC9_GEOAI|nr:isochorismatase [Geoglobus acetivorans]
MRPALVVVDMQKDFCYPDGKLFGGEHLSGIFEPTAKAVREARKKMPVIFTQDWHRKDDPEFDIWPEHCLAASDGAEIIDELEVREEDYIVRKRRYSAFFGTDLDLTLRELGIEKLYITGVLTNICVLHTAGDAVLRGYKVAVIRDCTAALNDYDYEYALKHMENVFNARIITLSDFLRGL